MFRARVPIAIGISALTLTLGCNSGKQNLSVNNGNGNSLTGAGSTFIYPIMTRWVSGIYLAKIKTWHDPAVAKDNPGVNLPNDNIVVAHRSDGSGTTNIFTTYLAQVSPEWKNKVGQGISVKWPAGVGGKGSEGVTGVVKQTPGGIGYVELTYAKENNLPVVLIRNRAGKWVEPSAAGTTAAMALSDELAKDVRTPIVDPPASATDAYPISGLTFLLIPKQGKNPAKTQTVKQFTQYVITRGQNQAERMFYAKLPQPLQQQDQSLFAQEGTNSENNRAALTGMR